MHSIARRGEAVQWRRPVAIGERARRRSITMCGHKRPPLFFLQTYTTHANIDGMNLNPSVRFNVPANAIPLRARWLG